MCLVLVVPTNNLIVPTSNCAEHTVNTQGGKYFMLTQCIVVVLFMRSGLLIKMIFLNLGLRISKPSSHQNKSFGMFIKCC